MKLARKDVSPLKVIHYLPQCKPGSEKCQIASKNEELMQLSTDEGNVYAH